MAVTFDQLLKGFQQVESGGRYSAVGPSVRGHRAYGRYQVMDYNVGKWTAQYYGWALTPEQFLKNHEAQEAVARGVLKGYFTKYGAEGAAAMWFSGQPNPNSSRSDGSLTVRQYVDRVIKAAGGSTGSVGGSAPVAQANKVTPKLDDKTLATLYGLSQKLINSSKQLKDLFKEAVGQGWSPEVFVAHLKNTDWWATNSDPKRKYLTDRYTDPATWQQKWNQFATAANSLAVQVGIGNLLGGGTSLGKMNDLLEKATYHLYADGWTQDQLKSWLGSQVTTHGSVMWGEAGENYDKLHALAYSNGMTYSQKWYADQAKAIVGGKKSFEQLEAEIRQQAAARWKGYGTQIQAGVNALDLAAPYIQTVSQLLELPSTDVDLSNKLVSKAMSTTNKDGSTYSLWQLENDVRNDPKWRTTKNAQDSISSVAHDILHDFGLIGA